MHRILHFLRPITEFNYRRPLIVLLASLLQALFAGNFALKLKIDTDIASLLPDTNKNVQALKKLQESVGGETVMEVAIRSSSFEANKRFAEELINRSLDLFDEKRGRPFFNRAEFRRDTEHLRQNALYLATEQELTGIIDFLQDEIDKAREQANPFYVDLGLGLEEEEKEEVDLEKFHQAYREMIPTEYPVNADSTLMIVKMFPAGSQSDIGYLEDLFEEYDRLIVSMNPASYHPDMEVRFGGRLKRHLQEFKSVMNDVYGSFAAGFSSVALLVALYFFLKKYINYRKGSLKDQKF